MKVFDKSGVMYHVKDVDKMFKTVSIESLLTIYEGTLLSHEIHTATDNLMIAIEEQKEPVYPAQEVLDGLAEMKKRLLDADSDLEMELNDIENRIENYVIDVLRIKERKNDQS